MSDVSNHAPLNSPLNVNPVFPLFEKCVRKVYNAFHNKMKTDPQAKTELVYGSDFFADEYDEFLIITDDNIKGLEQFKKTLFRGLSCQIKSFSLVTPVKGKPYYNVCRSQGCPNCAPYQAVNRLNYIDCMIRYATYTDTATAEAALKEVKNALATNDWPWLTVTLTPYYTGGGMLRIGNLMPHLDNPLTEEDFVRNSIADFDSLFNFDKVTKIKSAGIEMTYLTSGGTSFTSTDLYQMRQAGRVGEHIREKGTAKGFFFNAETNSINYETASQRKERKDKEAGAITIKNVPGIALESAPKKVIRNTLVSVGRQISLHPERMVLPDDNAEGMAIQSVKMMHLWKDKLELAGYPQPDHFNAVKISQEDFDEFKKYSIIPTPIPDNILDMKITVPENTGKLRYWFTYARTHELIRAQDRVKSAPTIQEWAETILEKVYDTLE